MPKKYTRSKHRKQIRLGFLILGLLLVIILIGNLIRFMTGLNQPLTKDYNFKNYTWDGVSNINLLVKGVDLTLFSYNPSLKTIKLISIPEKLYVDVPEGFGSWQIRSIPSLKTTGRKLLVDSVSNLFGLPIDGFIETDSSSKEFLNSLKNPVKTMILISKIKSSLTMLEFLKVVKGVNQTRFDRVFEFDLSSQLMDSKLADGTVVLIADTAGIDSFILKELPETKIKDEQASIAIFNGTNHSGLAQKASRIVSNLGGNVIIATNLEDQKQVEKSYIITQGSFKETTQRLAQIFLSKYDTLEDKIIDSRAQINIILGEDFVKN